MIFKRWIVTFFLIGATTGCATVEFNNTQSAGAPSALATQGHWQHIYLFGLWTGSSPIDLAKACPDHQWGRVITERTLIQTLVSISLFYTPATLYVECEPAHR